MLIKWVERRHLHSLPRSPLSPVKHVLQHQSSAMDGDEKPRLWRSSTTRSPQHLSFLFCPFLTLCISLILGCAVTHFLPTSNDFELLYSLSYFSAFFSMYLTMLA
ncbi:hypothetical protein B0H11DRAFT_198969 [Mycena galericulata]|nr:hypothetical protein B0H11DRAFT_198969 [Mycena galericulata]